MVGYTILIVSRNAQLSYFAIFLAASGYVFNSSSFCRLQLTDISLSVSTPLFLTLSHSSLIM